MSEQTKLNVGSRHTLRGLKRCQSCGQYNGNRSQVCQNKECPMRRQILNLKKSMDSIQLVSYTEAKLYSVRVKERDCAPRNFVQITDTTLSSELDSSIVSRNAICYIDTCKYDSNDVDISCKHVKSASESTKQAENFPIQYDALWGLRIGVEQKVRLWEMYKEDELLVPAVQRINKTTFVTKCTRSHVFPSGRLHVTALTVDSASKTDTHSCACKKLKILMSPNNSVVLKEDICDHLLLVLAAVLSRPSSQSEFSNFTKELKAYWMLDITQCKNEIPDGAGNEDIFIFDNELLPTDDLSDFTDNILKSVLRDENANSNSHQNMYQGDPSMVSGCTIDDTDMPFDGITCAIEAMNDESTRLELSDCNIELMDQFQLTNQIDLCNDEVILSNSDLFQGNSIVMPDLSDTIIEDLIVAQNQNQAQILNPVVAPTKIVEAVALTVSPKKPKKIIVAQNPGSLIARGHSVKGIKPVDPGPSLEYTVWLDHVIECINMNVDYNCKDPNILLSFNVHEDVFAHFSKSFASGVKCRLPNNTVLVKKGKFKGLLKYTWILRSAAKVQSIFSTKNMSIEVERRFQPSGDTYTPYVDEHRDLIVLNRKYKKISPKMCIAHICFDCNSNVSNVYNQRTGFKLDWVPNVFPKSGFGILNIEFSIGLKQ